MASICSRFHLGKVGAFTTLGRNQRYLFFRSQSSVSISDEYKRLVVAGQLSFDENQYTIVKYLNRLNKLLWEDEKERARRSEETIKQEPSSSCISPPSAVSISRPTDSGNEQKGADKGVNATPLEQRPTRRLRGLYVYGSVGTGKTAVMDLFFTHCALDENQRRRVHFHKFMLEIHKRIHDYKQYLIATYGREVNINLSVTSERDAITHVAEEIAGQCRLLCFDEFQVTDICDAMILTKLFNVLWNRGTLLVATSNRPPSDLYKEGANRQYFVPFNERLQTECVVLDMQSGIDYRQLTTSAEGAYFTPVSDETSRLLMSAFIAETDKECPATICKRRDLKTRDVPVMMGRTVPVLVVSPTSRMCYVHFKTLCEQDRGASDYSAVCRDFDSVYLDGVPTLSVLCHDKARRFITLVDELYDAGVKVVWTAATMPQELFQDVKVCELVESQTGVFGVDHAWTTTKPDQSTPLKEPIDTVASSDSCGAISSFVQQSTAAPSSVLSPSSSSLSSQEPSSTSSTQKNTTPTGTIDTTTVGMDAAEDELKLMEGELASIQELKFAFRRASSRLTEMASVGYRQQWEKRRKGKATKLN